MRIMFGRQEFQLHWSGALFWTEKKILVVADAHLEKGSFYAPKGYHLPPYDSHDTLTRLLDVCKKLKPEKILILGDFFHDNLAFQRLSPESFALFLELKKYPIIWIKGNHDAGYMPEGLDVYDTLDIDGYFFRHEASGGNALEISGHFHPKSEFTFGGKRIKERCFIEDGKKLILPAFGAYTGGLSVKDPAIRRHFTVGSMRQYLIVNKKVIYVPDLD